MDNEVATIPEFGVCKKCGRKFIPNWLDKLKVPKFSTVCATCALASLEKFLSEPE